MNAVQLDIPEETLISLKTDAASFAQDLKLLAAVKLFELGKLSSGGAAQLAGMARVEFLLGSASGPLIVLSRPSIARLFEPQATETTSPSRRG
jgi:hypothetical protein